MTIPSRASIILVGCGKMGHALLRGWLSGKMDPRSVIVVEPAPPVLPADCPVVSSFTELPQGLTPEVVVLAVKPQIMDKVAPPYAIFAKTNATFLSIAAGKPISCLQTLFGSTTSIVRAMPNTPAAVGLGMTVLYAGPHVSALQKTLCHSLAEGIGAVAWIEDEQAMDAVTALSGSGPAYVFHLVEALAQAGEALGLSLSLSTILARQTVIGAGALLSHGTEDAATLRQMVTSPGGTTEAALKVLMNQKSGIAPLLLKALDAAARRSKELPG